MVCRLTCAGLAWYAAIAACAGCSPYVPGFDYQPRPAVNDLSTPPRQPTTRTYTPPLLTAYAIIMGVRRPDPKGDFPLAVEVRLRLDNRSQAIVRFDPSTLEMTNAHLVAFRAPRVVSHSVDVPPQQTVIVEAFFPFPSGLSYDDPDLRGLHLAWSVRIGSQTVPQRANFRRVHHYYFHDPNWGLPPGYPSAYYGVGPMPGVP